MSTLSPKHGAQGVHTPSNTTAYMQHDSYVPQTFVEKLIRLSIGNSVGMYLLGGIVFLIGSILYYPRYYTLYDIEGEGSLIGAWLFVVGCFAFLFGSMLDTWQNRATHLQPNMVYQVAKYNPFITGVLNIIGSILFVVGAFYFVPVFYATNGSAGCWLFFFGCVVFCLAIIVDWHRMYSIEGNQSVSNLFNLWSAVNVGNFIGCVMFILGSYFFLPKYISIVEDPDLSSSNLVYAVNYFVVGSVFFVVAPLLAMVLVNKDWNQQIQSQNDRKNIV